MENKTGEAKKKRKKVGHTLRTIVNSITRMPFNWTRKGGGAASGTKLLGNH